MANRFNSAAPVVTPPAWVVYIGLIGAMSVQPLLLGVWAGVGPGKLLTRFPIVSAAQILLVFAGSFKRWNAFMFWGTAPTVSTASWGALSNLSIVGALSMFAYVGVIAYVAGRMTKRKILRMPFSAPGPGSGGHFTVKYLLGLTAICAALLAIGRLISFEQSSTFRWYELAFAGLFSSVVGGFMLVAAPVLSLLILSKQVRTRRHAANLAGACLVSLLTMIAMCLVTSQPMPTFLGQLLPMLIGAMTSGVLTALPISLAGYRFIRLPPASDYGTNYLSDRWL
jgi:hypothetical protein